MPDYEPYDPEFEQLLDDMALGREVREQFERDAAREQHMREVEMRKSFDADSDRELLEKMSMLKARTAAWAAEAPKPRVKAYAERRAAHVELARRGIPEVLAKALDIQRRGGCTALDVARLQAECHHLAERFL